jgi:hypothetical protein
VKYNFEIRNGCSCENAVEITRKNTSIMLWLARFGWNAANAVGLAAAR